MTDGNPDILVCLRSFPLSFRRKIRLASATLAFMLFSALSPAMAGALFAGDAQVLGRMLQVPAAPAAAANGEHGEHKNHHAQHGASHEHPAAQGNTTECADHGVFCSFCLSASSTTTLPLWSAPLWLHATAGGEKVIAFIPAQPLRVHAGARHLRDPPRLPS